MKTTWTALASALLVLLAGCASSATRMDRVQNGMTRERVLVLLGTPDGMRTRGNLEYLTYYLTADAAVGEQPYMVRLLDRHVDTVGRFVQLADLEAVGNGSPKAGMGAILSAQALPDVAAQLRQLAAQKKRGELSEAEFLNARQELLTK